MNAGQQAWEALRRLLRDSDDMPGTAETPKIPEIPEPDLPAEEKLIAAGVDPREAKIRAMKYLSDDEKEVIIARLRAQGAPLYSREQFGNELEVADSPLCDCDSPDVAAPTSPFDRGQQLAHHCDCAAVQASAIVRRGESVTRHGRDCGCLVVDRSVRERFGWQSIEEAERAGDARIYRFDRDE